MTNEEIFLEMENFAKENKVPIMLKDSINYLMDFIKKRDIKNILEIGSAIGYSAMKMASVSSFVKTIEKDEKRFQLAKNYIEKSILSSKIELILSDALDLEIKENYDLILIDAAKSKNLLFLDKFKKNLNNGGYIIIDNIDFHNLTGKSSEIKSRRLRSLVKKIEKFVDYLKNQNEFKVIKIEIGDGLVLLERI